jgi:starch phosphorylase
MKFMMNGAITLGTYDGANVEICDLVGEENIKIFGLRTNEVNDLYASGRYFAWNEYNADRHRLGRVIDQLTDGTFARQSGNFELVHDELMVNNDQYLVCRDFHAYVQAWEEVTNAYVDTRNWNRVSLHNTARSGFFSSDRTIREYAADIWHVGD